MVGIRITKYQLYKSILTNIDKYDKIRKYIIEISRGIFSYGLWDHKESRLKENVIPIIDSLIKGDTPSSEEEKALRELEESIEGGTRLDDLPLTFLRLTHDVDENRDFIVGLVLFENNTSASTPCDNLRKMIRQINTNFKCYSETVVERLESLGIKTEDTPDLYSVQYIYEYY